MNPLLLAALVNNIAVPELTRWLTSLHSAGTPLTEAEAIRKLLADADFGVKMGEAWLAAHPQA